MDQSPPDVISLEGTPWETPYYRGYLHTWNHIVSLKGPPFAVDLGDPPYPQPSLGWTQWLAGAADAIADRIWAIMVEPKRPPLGKVV